MASTGLHYLTLQDMIWINTQVTHQPQSFHYATLEEATFYQYGYGSSLDLFSQAGRFAANFSRKRPLAAGNEATGFIALVGFLAINDHELNLSDADATGWYMSFAGNPDAATEAIKSITKASDGHHEGEPPVAAILASILERYPKTVAALLQQDSLERLA